MLDGRWRHAVDRTTKPVGSALVRAGITADVLTIIGLVMSVALGVVVASGHLLIAIAMLFAAGLPDLFDGPVAKVSGTASVRGAFFDSVADRVADGFMFGGVAWYLVIHHHGTMALLPFAIAAMTQLISYERAKAELLGLSAKGGLMERAERFILLGVCFIAGGVSAAAFVPALWVFFGLITATAAGRFVRVWQEAEGPVKTVARRRSAESRWRTWREARAYAVADRTRVSSARPRGDTLVRWRTWRESAAAARAVRVRRRGDATRARVRAGR
ncbi:MAG TPA: CDP-alcohol phosphatidyltransferase family protein, partial [Acidimicrobiales bacterium]|nr:CDP-alcohol phosphatidyltransferase family protein [Acidimicrobiales bacterium]